jgi:hypothetical protein
MKATTRFLPVLALLATTATQPVSAQVTGAAPSIHFNVQVTGAAPSIHFNVLPPMMGDLQVGGQNYFEFRYTENSGASDYALRVSYSEDFSNGGDPPANWQYLSEPLFDGNRDRVQTMLSPYNLIQNPQLTYETDLEIHFNCRLDRLPDQLGNDRGTMEI